MAGIMDSFDKLVPLDEMQYTPELSEAMLDTMTQLESGNRPGVIISDFNKKPSIGLGQWNDSRARKLLERIRTADPSVAMQYIAEQDRIDNEYILREKEKLSQLLSTDVGVSTQKKQLREDMAGYKAIAEKWGVVGTPAQVLVSDLIHRYGARGAKQFVNKGAPTTLTDLFNKLKAYEERGAVQGGSVQQDAQINARRFSRYAEALSGEAGAVMDLADLGKEVLKMKTDSNYRWEPAPNDSVSPEMKAILATAAKVPAPDFINELSKPLEVEPYQSQSLQEAKQLRQSLKELFMPKQQAGQPFNFGGLIQALFALFEG